MKALLSTSFLRQPVASLAGGMDEASRTSNPLSLQVPQKELDQLSERLRKKCEHRFAAILRGEGPKLHTFGEGGGNASEEACHGLNGTICHTQAHILQTQVHDGRKMRQTSEMEGQGCLPTECLDAPDLQELTKFMQDKAQSTIPGTGTEVSLHVDCSKNGGSVANSGLALKSADKLDKAHKSTNNSESTGEAKKPVTGSRSAAASVAISIPTVMVALGVAMLLHATLL